MIKFYTTHCPRCSVIEKKLKEKNIQYEEITDVEEMLKLGISSVPVLGIDDKLLDFGTAITWLRTQ